MPPFLPTLCGVLGILLFLVGGLWNLGVAAESGRSGGFSLWLDPMFLLCLPQTFWPFVLQVVGIALFYAAASSHGA